MIWWAMVGTWGFHFLGALYIVAPVLAWSLAGFALLRSARTFAYGGAYDGPRVSVSVALWFVGMGVMLLALLLGHLDQGLSLKSIVKSSIGWAKGWALLALFPLIGCLAIRPALVIRAACIVGLHTLCLVPLFVLAWLVGAPQVAWVSPLKAIGGPGPEFFMVSLYEIDPGSGLPRWRLFTPWAPALGFVANVYFLFALHEPERRWRAVGIAGAVCMIAMSQSRLAIVCLASVSIATWGIANLSRPLLLYVGAFASAALGLVASPLLALAESAATAFTEARADSSRVRSALARIAVDRWRREAPIWGHGVVERGPHLVEFMPIGSHHSWYGLLFVKGIAGFLALALPMLASFCALAWNAVTAPPGGERAVGARVGLGVVLILFLYTFGENLEILAYLVWPGLLFLGIGTRGGEAPVATAAHRRPASSSSRPASEVDILL